MTPWRKPSPRFKKGDFAAALVSLDLALAQVPGDVALHEFRALIFFALGRFDDSAGVLNAVLASGPGWDWTTMTGLFDAQETYVELLRKLEDYTDAHPDSAATHFMRGYHYLVLGKLAGEFGIAEDNLLVLSSEDSQLVGEITFPEDSKLGFTLAGGPRGGPGLNFERVP